MGYRLFVMTVLVPAMAATALGQRRSAGTPLDPGVGQGPLGTSLRRVEPGLGRYNPRASVHRLARPSRRPTPTGLTQRYLFAAPGVRAYIRRPDYLVISPGGGVARGVSPRHGQAAVPIAGADTVFDLTPGSPAKPAPEANPQWVDHRLDGRLGRIGGLRIQPRPVHARVGGPRINAGTRGLAAARRKAAVARRNHIAEARSRATRGRRAKARQLPRQAIFPSAKPSRSSSSRPTKPSEHHARRSDGR